MSEDAQWILNHLHLFGVLALCAAVTFLAFVNQVLNQHGDD
jgi:hypothetical protein